MNRATEELVRTRAGNRCEYCQLAQAQYPLRFEIDHVIAEQHGGREVSENLALSCPKCNRHKGPNLTGIDGQSGAVAELFHPRRQVWQEHFRWSGPVLVGMTATGRATVAVLNINDPVRITLRQLLIDEGVFPDK
jgi:hypothetical protein